MEIHRDEDRDDLARMDTIPRLISSPDGILEFFRGIISFNIDY